MMKFILTAILVTVPLFFGGKQIAAQFSSLDSLDLSQNGENPIVVELFTSQSCSSCPPADKVLSELSENENIIALSCHVTYWNHLHWKDTLSREFCTQRQRQYSAHKGSRRIYTPQMVVNGEAEFVGSRRSLAKAAIENAQKAQNAKFTLIAAQEGAYDIDFSAFPQKGSYTLWLVGYGDDHTQAVPSGENRGRTLFYTNPVTNMRKVGTWDGHKKTIRVQMPDEFTTGQSVLLIQENDVGRILGASRI